MSWLQKHLSAKWCVQAVINIVFHTLVQRYRCDRYTITSPTKQLQDRSSMWQIDPTTHLPLDCTCTAQEHTATASYSHHVRLSRVKVHKALFLVSQLAPFTPVSPLPNRDEGKWSTYKWEPNPQGEHVDGGARKGSPHHNTPHPRPLKFPQLQHSRRTIFIRTATGTPYSCCARRACVPFLLSCSLQKLQPSELSRKASLSGDCVQPVATRSDQDQGSHRSSTD